MSFTAAIDISTFIWCKDDYDSNKNQYHGLISLVPTVYEQIKSLKIPVLIRKELYELILVEFPYSMAEEISYEFQRLTLSFLTDTVSNWTPYVDDNDKAISSVPGLVKPHFSENAQAETQSQICHLFNNGQNPQHKFLAYNHFFGQKKNLALKKEEQKTVEIETLCYNSEKEIQDFFELYKIKFDHNPKHTEKARNANGERISPFTCFHQKDGQTKAQKLLDEAFLHEDDYYNFDIENGVYVKFVKTIGLTYHGFDLSDDNNNVPNEIKKKINKDGRVF
jgi:hypothetical protein